MKKELVIHIGLPKTATTYIQRLMNNQSNYLGLESENSWFSRTLLNIFSDFSKGKNVDKSIDKWSSKLNLLIVSNNIERPIVISNEFFFSGELNRVNEFPLISNKSEEKPLLIEFISYLKVRLNNFFKIKILLTIRNQMEWLASKYAQASRKIINASQKDFENRLDFFSIHCDEYWFNWSFWVVELDNVLGKDNVYVLCMEEMNQKGFWEKLSSIFMGDNIDLLSLASHNLMNINQKRKGEVEWELDEFMLGSFLAKKYAFTPGSISHFLVDRVGNMLSLLGMAKTKKTIKLNDSIRSKYGLLFSSGNSFLENRLRKDLSSLKYSVVESVRG